MKYFCMVLLGLFLLCGYAQAETIIKQRGDTAATWAAINPVLGDREVGWETDTRKAKLGNGVTAWNALPYVVSEGGGGGVSDHGALTGRSDDDHTQYLTDARGDAKYSLLGHSQPAATISDSTAAGRSLLTALDMAAARTLLNTDQVSDTRAPSAHTHPSTEINDSGATGRSLVQAADQSAARTTLGLGTMYAANSGTGIGQHPPLVDVGTCSDAQYTDQSTCQTNGGTWTPVPGWRLSGVDVPKGSLTQDGVTVPTVDDIAWAALPDKPNVFPPDTHNHDQTDITGLVARLVALEDQVTQLDANLSLAGFPTLTIDQASPVTFTAASTDLTGTYSDNGTVTALEYQVDGGAWANVTPLASPWSLTINGASLTPNVASTVNIRATDDTALARTKSVSLTYQTPVLALSPASWDFGSVGLGQVSATKAVTLTNSGQATSATLTTAKTGTDAAQFDITLDTCNGQTLAPLASCAVTMAYSPDAPAVHSGGLSVGGQSVSLSGTGVPSVTSVTDDFNRANGGLGANWTTDSTATATPTINTNSFVSGTFNVVSYANYTGATFANNQYAQALTSSVSGYLGVGCRGDGNGNGYAMLAINSTTIGAYKITNGTRSTLGSLFTVASTVNKTMKLTCSGTTLEAFLDGASIGTRTDSSYTSGNPFIYSNQSSVTYKLDDFAAGDL